MRYATTNCFLTCLGGLLLLSSPPASARTPVKPLEIVIIVGNNRHVSDSERVLSYADDGAVHAAELFRAIVPDAVVKVLATLDEETGPERLSELEIEPLPATRAELDRTTEALRRVVQEARMAGPREVTLFFYYAGYGEPGGTLHLEDTVLRVSDLQASLALVNADKVFAILDAYHPTPVARQRSEVTAPPSLIPGSEEYRDSPPWLGYVGATTGSQQVENGRGGLFTYVALNGLLGAADRDRDYRITFYEWSRYILMQIDTNKPFAPSVRVLSPKKDPLITVVDRNRSISSGLLLEEDIPQGSVRICRAGSGETVTQLYHYQGLLDSLRLLPGEYTMIRYSDRTARLVKGPGGKVSYISSRVYPAEKVSVKVEHTGLTILNGETRMERVFFVPEAQEGGRKFPEGAQVETLSAREELELIGLLFRTTRDRAFELPASSWSLSARFYLPYGPPPFVMARGDAGGAREASSIRAGAMGGFVRASRIVPHKLEYRWYTGRTFFMQYGVVQGVDVRSWDLDSNLLVQPSAWLHQLRLGPGFTQVRIGRNARWILEESISYGPMFVIGGSGAAGGGNGSVSNSPSLRFASFTEVLTEASFGLMFSLGPRMELGPVVSAQASFFHLHELGRVLFQSSIGLELRPKAIQ